MRDITFKVEKTSDNLHRWRHLWAGYYYIDGEEHLCGFFKGSRAGKTEAYRQVCNSLCIELTCYSAWVERHRPRITVYGEEKTLEFLDEWRLADGSVEVPKAVWDSFMA